MIPIEADIEITLGSGPAEAYNPSLVPFVGQFRFNNASIHIRHPFCSKHPGNTTNFGGSGECWSCNEEIRATIWNELGERVQQLETQKLNCLHIAHDHECRCFQPHQCDESCPSTPVDDDAHPLTKLAAIDLPPGLTDLYTKLGRLEDENARLRSTLRQVGEALVRLSENAQEEPHDEPAAVGDIVREALAGLQ